MTDAPIHGLSAIADDYDAILCDVWGVVHNGVDAHWAAGDALSRFRATGKPVVLITNAPRPSGPVIEQLARLGVPDDAFDAVVSSGDVVHRHLLTEAYPSIYYIGPKRDLALFDGISSRFAETATEADAVVVTDMRSDTEHPDDYKDELAALVPLTTPFICANPDVVVERGGSLVFCGGALARVFDQLGGRALQFGKPHAPIYEMAKAEATRIAPGASRFLAIGDGLPTDITGANRQGLDVLFITDGIHAHELGTPGAPDPAKVEARLAQEGLRAAHYIPRLAW